MDDENTGGHYKNQTKTGYKQILCLRLNILIVGHKRFTLAVKYIRKGEKLEDIIDFLIKEVKSVGFKIKDFTLIVSLTV